MRYSFREIVSTCFGIIGIIIAFSGVAMLLWLGISASLTGSHWTIRAVGIGLLLLQFGFALWLWRRLREARAIDAAHEQGEHDWSDN